MGVMIGPILGPTLGGYLTEVASWRWTFYINIPVGILSLLLIWKFLPETQKRNRHMNWLGLGILWCFIAGLQYLLDRGNHQDWFSAWDIRIAGFFILMGVLGFVLPSWRRQIQCIVNLDIFRDSKLFYCLHITGTILYWVIRFDGVAAHHDGEFASLSCFNHWFKHGATRN